MTIDASHGKVLNQSQREREREDVRHRMCDVDVMCERKRDLNYKVQGLKRGKSNEYGT
jgi:hypothetical protein